MYMYLHTIQTIRHTCIKAYYLLSEWVTSECAPTLNNTVTATPLPPWRSTESTRRVWLMLVTSVAKQSGKNKHAYISKIHDDKLELCKLDIHTNKISRGEFRYCFVCLIELSMINSNDAIHVCSWKIWQGIKFGSLVVCLNHQTEIHHSFIHICMHVQV